jgi:hypothetical protein
MKYRKKEIECNEDIKKMKRRDQAVISRATPWQRTNTS